MSETIPSEGAQKPGGAITRWVNVLRGPFIRKYRKWNRRWYRRRFHRDPTATLAIQGVRFRFHDPGLVYLWRHFVGPRDGRPEPYEPAVMVLLKRLLAGREPCGFLDIGAHHGYFTAYVAALNGQCEIHAFEPGPEFVPVLRRNIELNHIQARIHEVALSDEAGETEFARRSMMKPQPGSTCHTVKTIPLDALRQQEPMRADLVKIDVHGSEGKVLRGMRRTLAEDVNHLLLELHPQAMLVDATVRHVVDAMREAGLELFEMEQFRRAPEPLLRPVDADRYTALIDMNRWSEPQVNDRRMIYARRPQKE